VEPTDLSGMLVEAKAMLADGAHMKSNSSRALTLFLVRLLEVQVHGKALTPKPDRYAHPEDDPNWKG
jgi:hypothetical protein